MAEAQPFGRVGVFVVRDVAPPMRQRPLALPSAEFTGERALQAVAQEGVVADLHAADGCVRGTDVGQP